MSHSGPKLAVVVDGAAEATLVEVGRSTIAHVPLQSSISLTCTEIAPAFRPSVSLPTRTGTGFCLDRGPCTGYKRAVAVQPEIPNAHKSRKMKQFFMETISQ